MLRMGVVGVRVRVLVVMMMIDNAMLILHVYALATH